MKINENKIKKFTLLAAILAPMIYLFGSLFAGLQGAHGEEVWATEEIVEKIDYKVQANNRTYERFFYTEISDAYIYMSSNVSPSSNYTDIFLGGNYQDNFYFKEYSSYVYGLYPMGFWTSTLWGSDYNSASFIFSQNNTSNRIRPYTLGYNGYFCLALLFADSNFLTASSSYTYVELFRTSTSSYNFNGNYVSYSPANGFSYGSYVNANAIDVAPKNCSTVLFSKEYFESVDLGTFERKIPLNQPHYLEGSGDVAPYEHGIFSQFFFYDNFLAESGRKVINGTPDYGFAPAADMIRYIDSNMLHLANLEWGYLVIGYIYYAFHVTIVFLMFELLMFFPHMIENIYEKFERGL